MAVLCLRGLESAPPECALPGCALPECVLYRCASLGVFCLSVLCLGVLHLSVFHLSVLRLGVLCLGMLHMGVLHLSVLYLGMLHLGVLRLGVLHLGVLRLGMLCLVLQRVHPPYHQGHLFRGFPESQMGITHWPDRPSSTRLLSDPLFILSVPPLPSQYVPFSPLVRHLPLPCEINKDVKKLFFKYS